MACVIVGDEVALAKKLRVPVSILVDWLLGVRPLPPDVFLGVVDIVLESTKKQVQDERAFLDQIKRRHR